MKTFVLNSAWKVICFVTCFLLMWKCDPLSAQDGPQRVYMYLDYFQTNEEQYLICETKYRPDRIFLQLVDANIEFTLVSDTAEITLGTVKTDQNGKARFDLKESDVRRDTAGMAQFQATFAGTEEFKRANRTVESKRIKLSMESIEKEDSTHTLQISGIEYNGDETIYINDKDIQVFVKRSFSNLPIGEGSIDDGTFEMSFPDDLPGDTAGNLTVIAQIIEDDDYGTAEVQKEINWGLPLPHVEEEKPRALWSRAPLWIIIAVTLSFAAAWYHYFLSISKLFKLRKL